MRATFSRLLLLKPYGDQLLDGMAEVWLVFARLNIVSIALCDAVAWAYFGYTTGRGATGWVTAALAGVIVFILVASLDAMFVMHDRSHRQQDASRARRDQLALVARIVLVVLTFTVTAPFLTQLFFARDIEANIQRRNEQTIAAKRAEVIGRFDRRLHELRATLGTRQRDLETEISGTGRSGRYGRGPTAASIEQQIASLQNDLSTTEAARATEQRAFDAAVASPETLASRYGVDLVREGPEVRARVIGELEKSATFRSTQRTIKAFLVFMFLGLVCLKLFQPESVRIYYSARLQSAFQRMQAGVFNHRLDPREHPEAAGMNPIRFADWYENDQVVRDGTDRLRDQTASALERLRAQEEAVRVLQDSLRADIARMSHDLTTSAEANDSLEEQLVAQQQELNAMQAKIAEEQQALDDFRYDTTSDLSLRDQQLLLSTRSTTVRRLADHRGAAAALAGTIHRLTQRLEASRGVERQVRDSLSSMESESAALSSALQKSRERRLADIVEGG